jgi:predicted nucleotidyltransferase
MNDNELKKNIIRTLCYFDIFDHPLTVEELHRYLFSSSKIESDDFLEAVNRIGVSNKFGYYFLDGREQLVEIRRARARHVDKKLNIAKKAARVIKYVPFVRAVFVCNNVAFDMADEDSDIDVLIIIKSGRLWIGRLLVTALLSILGLRRTKNNITNKICLSFYLSDKNLNLKDVSLKGEDIYMIYWVTQIFPVYDPDDLASSMRAANRWIENFVVNLSDADFYGENIKDNFVSRAIKKFFHIAWGGVYGDIIEKQAKETQLVKMRANKHSVQNHNDTRVVINDNMLKFHENDRRELFKAKWFEKCKQYGV